MSVYHIGDLHLGHRNICAYREQFSTVEEHNEFVVDQVLSVLSKRDKLFLHGDICFDKPSLDLLRKITEYIEVPVLILGNHDLESSTRPTMLELIDLFGNRIYSMLKYKKSWLTHAPLHPDELRGLVNIHGHVHSNSIENDTRFINVSCEVVDYKPIEHVKLMEAYNQTLK